MTQQKGGEAQTLDFEQPLIEVERKIEQLRGLQGGDVDFSREIGRLEQKASALRKKIFGKLTPWQRVLLARHVGRPRARDFIEHLLAERRELSGDRQSGDDPTLLGVLGWVHGGPVLALGQQKQHGRLSLGVTGLHKARRLLELAARFGLPVLTFVDAPGLHSGGPAAARRGAAAASCLRALVELPVPTVACVIGELCGPEGLALAVCDRVVMLEHAIASVAAPEAVAVRLWDDEAQADKAAEALHLSAADAHRAGLVDEVLAEPDRGGHRAAAETCEVVATALRRQLGEIRSFSATERRQARRQRYASALARR